MNCSSGATTRVPTEEKALTTPKIMLLRSGEADRAAAVIASEEPVQATATPTKAPDATNIAVPVAAAMIAMAAT